MAERTFYVVLGRADEATAWRKANEVPPRRVIRVWRRTAALRGLAARSIESVVVLPSWKDATAATRAAVETDLTIIGQTLGRRVTRSYPGGERA